MSARVAQINLSPGGVPKLPVARAHVGFGGVVGDAQSDLRLHGGPDRAVCLWSLDVIALLREEGHPVSAGSTGENLTLAGLDWARVTPGVRLQVGANVLLEITDYATPCRTIRHCFLKRRYGRISHKKYPAHSRVYARVLRAGELVVDDPVVLGVSAPA
ncbi:MAG: MOSC domain-containing protein [Kofleriaceae bacterium]